MVMAKLPNAPELLERAVELTGCDELGPDGWQDGLDTLLNCAAEAQLSTLGASVFRSWITDRLVRRLQLVDWARRHPTECGQPIARPLIVTGLGRSGTTFLLELLAADHSNRALMKWEAEEPIPPPDSSTFWSDPRIDRCVESTDRLYDSVPALRAVHFEPGDGPTECLALLGLAFRGCDFPGLFTLPTYMRWWLHADQAPAYEMHRLGLQVLQSRAPGAWTLKDPWHLLALEAALHVYPDARVVVLHRDPVTVVPSLAGLSAATGSDLMRLTPVDPHYWGTQYVDALSIAARRHVAARRSLPPDQFFDVSYNDLIADPVGVVASIYEFAGRPWTATSESAVRRHVDDRPQHKYGVHRYTLDEFGLTADAVREQFASYTTTFAELLEPRPDRR